ncbi:MAG: PDZ domain-containing protein [Planctomycetota bacterium]
MAKFLLCLLPLLFAVPAPEGWLGIYLDPERDEPVVAEVIPDSPAAKAGLQLGDVIVRFGGDVAPSRERVRAALLAAQPGDRCEVLVRRGGAEQRVFVRLGERPAAAVPKPAAGSAKPSRPAGPTSESAPPSPTAPTAPTAPTTAERDPGAVARPDPTASSRGTPTPAAPPVAPPAAQPAVRDVDAEITALRAELAELRRQLDELRRVLRRE